MTPAGYPPGVVAPNLDPADAVHIPRWLDELVQVAAKAARGLVRQPSQGERGGG